MSQEFLPDDNESVSGALEEDCPNDDSAASEQDVVCLTLPSLKAWGFLIQRHTLKRYVLSALPRLFDRGSTTNQQA